jgi:hypothetical protein
LIGYLIQHLAPFVKPTLPVLAQTDQPDAAAPGPSSDQP